MAHTKHKQARSFLVFAPLITNGSFEAGIQGFEIDALDGIGRFWGLLSRSRRSPVRFIDDQRGRGLRYGVLTA